MLSPDLPSLTVHLAVTLYLPIDCGPVMNVGTFGAEDGSGTGDRGVDPPGMPSFDEIDPLRLAEGPADAKPSLWLMDPLRL